MRQIAPETDERHTPLNNQISCCNFKQNRVVRPSFEFGFGITCLFTPYNMFLCIVTFTLQWSVYLFSKKERSTNMQLLCKLWWMFLTLQCYTHWCSHKQMSPLPLACKPLTPLLYIPVVSQITRVTGHWVSCLGHSYHLWWPGSRFRLGVRVWYQETGNLSFSLSMTTCQSVRTTILLS